MQLLRRLKLSVLLWAPRQEAFPVGYYCGLVDPDGQYVEFSFGQPLGPGAPELDELDINEKGRVRRGGKIK